MSYVTLDTVVDNEPIETDWGNQVKANFESMPRGVLDYAAVTGDQSGITSITDLTSLAVTVTVAAGRLIRITGHAQVSLAFSGTETLAAVGTVREGSTVLGRWGSFIDNGSGSRSQLQDGSVVIATSSAGSRTFKLSLARTTGSGSVGIDQDADNPAYILVEDIGPDPNI